MDAIARRNNLTPRVDATLAAIKVAHIDQTNESDLHFLTRLARQHDAVCTVKKGRLVFLPVNGTRSSTGEELAAITLTRAAGDQHRYHTADRHSYSGGLKYTEGFTRLWPSIGTGAAFLLSIGLLSWAMRDLPVGTAYAVWVGIGAVGTAIVGMAFLGETATAVRLGSLALVAAGIVGLKLSSSA